MPKKEGRQVRIRKGLSIFLIIALFIGAFLIALKQQGIADITQPAPTPSSSLPSEEELNKIFTPKNPATSLYKLNPNFKDAKVESWWEGVIKRTNNPTYHLFKDLSTNQMHFAVLYSLWSNTIPSQIIDVNLDTKEYRLVDGDTGRPIRMTFHPNGKIYSFYESPANFACYDPKTGKSKHLYTVDDTVATYDVILGPDLSIYLSTALKGKVVRYNPAKDPECDGNPEAFTDFGIIADPGPPYGRYLFNSAEVGDYIYGGIRDGNSKPGNWYLGVKKISTGESQKFWQERTDVNWIVAGYCKENQAYARLTVVDSQGNSSSEYYLVDGFSTPRQLSKEEFQSLCDFKLPYPEGFFRADMLYGQGYQVDGNTLTVDELTEGKATIRWQTPASSLWQEVVVPGIRMKESGLSAPLISLGNNLLFSVGEEYGPAVLFDTKNHAKTLLGYPSISAYKLFYSQVNKRVYFIGYPSAWKEWDPNKPWSPKKEFSVVVNPANNPHYMPRPNQNSPGHILAKYYFYITEDRNGLLYLTGTHARDSIGSSFFWYNPRFNYKGDVDLPLPFVNNENYGVIREEFKEKSIRGLTNALLGTKIIINYQTGLYVFDTVTKQIEKILPRPNGYGIGALIEVEPGIILGASMSPNALYKIDIRTGEVLATKEFPTNQPIFGSDIGYKGEVLKEFVWGPDHYVWLFIGNSIYRINPEGSSIEPEKVIDVGFPGYITFDSNNDLYITNRGPNIWVVRELFTRKSQEELLAGADYSLYTEKTSFFLKNQNSLTIPLRVRLETAIDLPPDLLPNPTLSVENLPQGLEASFSKESCQGSCETDLSLTNLNSLPAGEYRLTVLLTIPSLNKEPKRLPILLSIQKEAASLPPAVSSTAPIPPPTLSQPQAPASPQPMATPTIPLVQSITKGSSRESQTSNLRLLQETLIAYGYLRGRPTGSLNLATRLALSRFRKEYSLRAPRGSIIIDTATASAINNLRTKNISIPTLTTRSSYYFKARVIRLMQARLIELGYLRGRPNGLLNSATKKALAQFRKANNLPTPKRGIIIDPATANALNKR